MPRVCNRNYKSAPKDSDTINFNVLEIHGTLVNPALQKRHPRKDEANVRSQATKKTRTAPGPQQSNLIPTKKGRPRAEEPNGLKVKGGHKMNAETMVK